MWRRGRERTVETGQELWWFLTLGGGCNFPLCSGWGPAVEWGGSRSCIAGSELEAVLSDSVFTLPSPILLRLVQYCTHSFKKSGPFTFLLSLVLYCHLFLVLWIGRSLCFLSLCLSRSLSFLCIWVFPLHVCQCTTCMPGAQRRYKRMLDGARVTDCCEPRVGARYRTQVLWKSIQCS